MLALCLVLAFEPGPVLFGSPPGPAPGFGHQAYRLAYQACAHDRAPLVVFVGCEPRRVGGIARVVRWDGYPAADPYWAQDGFGTQPCVVVGRWSGGAPVRVSVLAAGATDEQIHEAISPPSRPPPPLPQVQVVVPAAAALPPFRGPFRGPFRDQFQNCSPRT